MRFTRVLRQDVFKAAEPVRHMGPLGRYFVERPNNVEEARKLFQTTARPTYAKKESDKMVLTGVFGLMGVCTLVWLVGAKDALLGTNKKTLA